MAIRECRADIETDESAARQRSTYFDSQKWVTEMTSNRSLQGKGVSKEGNAKVEARTERTSSRR